MMSQMEGGCPVDYNTITDLFLQVWFGHLRLPFVLGSNKFLLYITKLTKFVRSSLL